MKIICKDNYDRETVSDELVCTCTSEKWSKRIVKLLNINSFSNEYFIVVPDDHKLHQFKP